MMQSRSLALEDGAIVKGRGLRAEAGDARMVVLGEADITPHHEMDSRSAPVMVGSRDDSGGGTERRAPAIQKKPLYYRFTKRMFDIAFSACVIVVGMIPAVALSIAVAADTKSNPIYSQERVGKDGRTFRLLKLRTMVADADNVEKYLSPAQLEAWRRERKVEDDPRITPLGRFLRKTSADEFPQFVNVLLGNMSTIGPRAITKDELAWFGEDARLLLSVPCGITGLWQTGPRNEFDFQSGARQQVELSYVKNASLRLDARLFFKTFRAMLKGTGR